jgi:hypothetical protein
MSVATRPWSASHLRSEPARHPHVTVFGAEELNEQIRCTVSDDGVLDKLLRPEQRSLEPFFDRTWKPRDIEAVT